MCYNKHTAVFIYGVKMHTLSVVFGMLIGYLIYHSLSYLLNVGDASIWFKRNEAAILKILLVCVESAAFIQSAKVKQMKILGYNEESIKLYTDLDKQNFDLWKKTLAETLSHYYIESGRKPHYDFNKLLAHTEEIWRKYEAEAKNG